MVWEYAAVPLESTEPPATPVCGPNQSVKFWLQPPVVSKPQFWTRLPATASQALGTALASGAPPDSAQFHQGIELTLQQLRQLLRQHGIETQESVGQPFDPHQHEAVSLRHNRAQPDHAILEVLQRGYRRGEKVFRPAKVIVNDLTHPKHTHHGR